MNDMLNTDFSQYEGNWVRVVDTDGDVWQGWVSDVDYPDETDDGLWYLGFEHMLQNGKRSPVGELNQSEIKSIEITDKDWELGYRKYRDAIKK